MITYSIRSLTKGKGNEELVAKLKSEYDIETSDFDEAPENETVKAFIKDSPFEVRISVSHLS